MIAAAARLPSDLDSNLCETLTRRAVNGDEASWQQLVGLLWPVWLRLVRRSRAMGALARSDDHVHDVLAGLVAKLRPPEGRALTLYPSWHGRHPDKTFEDWVRIVTANAVRDYVRARCGSAPEGHNGARVPSVKRLLNELASSPALEQLGVRPPYTAAQTARQILELARKRLPEDQLGALGLWLEGASFDEIDDELALDGAGAGRLLVRAAIAVLRREFAGDRAPP